MATETKLIATSGVYGNTGNANFSNSAANHLYVGDQGKSVYRSRMTFSSLANAANLGSARVVITKALLYVRQNDGGGTVVTAGCSSSSAWNATLDASGSANITQTNASGWRSIDVTACANAIVGYSGNWYMHLRADKDDYIRFNGTSSDWKPYLLVTWEYVAATIKGSVNNVTLGNSVTYTITPEVSGETHTLKYKIGSTTGTIATKQGNSISWTPSTSLAMEITDDDVGTVEITMTAYNSSGAVQRTEKYYQTVTVPISVKGSISNIGATMKSGLSGYGLTGRSYLSIAPQIDMNNAQGAVITSVIASINEQNISWTNLTESSAGVFTGASVNTNVFTTAGTYTLTLTVMDSRGRSVTSTKSFTVCNYAAPAITTFSLERYEAVYDANEQISGYQASDIGDKVWLNLSASVTSVAPSGSQLNTLKWSIKAVNASTGASQTISGTGAQSVNISKDRNKFTGTVGQSDSYNYTLTVTDSAGVSTITYSSVVAAEASLAVKPGSVGVGCIPGGTKSNPLFKVAYPAEFNAVLKGLSGLFGADGYRLDKAVKTQTLTLSSSFGTYASDGGADFTPRVTRVGPIVFLSGMLTNTATMTLNTTEVIVSTLPSWAKPRTHVDVLQQGSSVHIWWMRVSADGKLIFSRYRSTGSTSYESQAAGKQFPITACWIAADAF